MKVVTQLADLFSCMHENKISFGFVNPHYIMIDKAGLNTWWSFISFGYLKIFLADFLIHVQLIEDLYTLLHWSNFLKINCFGLQESNIKVFDHGYVTDVYKVDPKILDHPRAPEIIRGMFALDLNIYLLVLL